MSRPPREPPLYLRLPALALSLAVGGFLVLQAGVPGCGSNEDKPQTEPAPASELPAAATKPTATAPTANQPADEFADKPNSKPADKPADRPADRPADKPADNPDSAAGTPPLPINADNSDSAHKKPADLPKPRFFPASKAMAPLIEPENLLPPKQAPKAQQAPPPQQAQQAPQAL